MSAAAISLLLENRLNLSAKDSAEKEDAEEETATPAERIARDAYVGLEAKVKLLQDKNLAPAEIIKNLLQEGYNADTATLAKILGLTVFDVVRVKAYVIRQSKKTAPERLEKTKTIPEAPKSQEPQKPSSVYRTETDSLSILKEILNTHPDVTERQILEIMSWANMAPRRLTSCTLDGVAAKHARHRPENRKHVSVEIQPCSS